MITLAFSSEIYCLIIERSGSKIEAYRRIEYLRPLLGKSTKEHFKATGRHKVDIHAPGRGTLVRTEWRKKSCTTRKRAFTRHISVSSHSLRGQLRETFNLRSARSTLLIFKHKMCVVRPIKPLNLSTKYPYQTLWCDWPTFRTRPATPWFVVEIYNNKTFCKQISFRHNKNFIKVQWRDLDVVYRVIQLLYRYLWESKPAPSV